MDMKWGSPKRAPSGATCLCALSLAGAMAGGAQAGSVQEGEGARWLRNGPELVQACRDEWAGGERRRGGPCTSYLLGYVDGNAQVAFSDTMPSGYMQNALRTRAPSHPQIEALTAVEYCLDSTENLGRAIAELDPGAVAAQTPAQIVGMVLAREHRCRS